MLDILKTKKQARKYRYFQWAGNPKGIHYNKSMCAYEVWERGRIVSAHQCYNKPGYGPEKLYCKIHSIKIERGE